MTKQEREQQRDGILALIQKGVLPKDISAQVGCCLSLVYLVAKDNGINITRTIAKKNLPADMIDSMKRDAASGMSSKEIGERYHIPASSVKEICRGCFAKKNQWGKIGTLDEGRVANTISERLPNWEYAGNYTGTDGKCDIRCRTCGTIKTVKSVAIRHGSARCSVCFERERIEREELKRAEIEKRKAQRRAELERQKQQTVLRREDKKKQERLDHISVFSCEVCGAMFLADDRRRNRFCSDACNRRAENKRRDVNRRIKISAQMVDHDISLERLYQRDGGICYLCGRVCDWNDREVVDGTVICGNTYPSIDHFIPLSKNGKHSWANVKLACRKCNTNKGDKLVEIDKKRA